MHEMENLKEMICRELEEIAGKGEMSAGDLDAVYKLVVSKEKLLRIEELEDNLGYSESGYMYDSGRGGNWNASGSYGRGHSYNGNSYGRNRMGRYSRAEGKEMVHEKLMEIMNEPGLTASDKAVLQRAIDQMK